MYWDRTSKRKNLVDARRLALVKKIPLADAMGMFPGKSRSQLDAIWAIGTEIDQTSKTIEEKRKREENTRPTPTTTSQRGRGLALAAIGVITGTF